jgi:hypothetical protein
MTSAPIRAAWKNRPGWSAFGRKGPKGNSHAGFDFYVPAGTPIYATGRGRVVGKGYSPDRNLGFGHNLTIELDDGRKTLDAHFGAASPLRIGDRVDENTVIGRVGNTGNAYNVFWSVGGQTLSHDHHQVWIGGRLVDPLTVYGQSAPAGGKPTPIPSTQPAAGAATEEEYGMSTIYQVDAAPTVNGDCGIYGGFTYLKGDDGILRALSSQDYQDYHFAHPAMIPVHYDGNDAVKMAKAHGVYEFYLVDGQPAGLTGRIIGRSADVNNKRGSDYRHAPYAVTPPPSTY